VFYVNGTDKKPEKATAAKIRSYLRRGTQVCPIVNIRGNADAFEREEDRKSLENHGQAGAVLQQTLGVLETELGKDVLLPGRCVQGLLAFSSLAISSESRSTSIHPSREGNLVLQQRNYLKIFESSAKAMFEFSQIKAVAQILHVKLTSFREDIIESNKIKVRELLAENISDLQQALKNHREFISKVNPEFDKCRESINGAIQSFERLITAGRKNLWNDFFNGLTDEVDQVVAENFGDNDRITLKIKKAFKTKQDNIQEKIQGQFEELLAELQSNMGQAMVRLVQDVRRVEFQQQINFDQGGQQAEYRAIDLDMALGLKGWGSIAFSIGSYTAMGAAIGTPGGPVVMAIGAAVGAVVGVLVSAMHFFTGKEKRIRKAQALVQEKIDEVRSRVMNGLSDEVNKVLVPVRNEIRDATLREVEAIYSSLTRPLDLIQKQITLMVRIKNQLEKMPHGTIQAIQY